MGKRQNSERKHSVEAASEPAENGGDGLAWSWLTRGRIVLLICAASIIAFSNSLAGEFVFDDVDQIVQNQTIRSWRNLSDAFSTHVWSFREATSDPAAPPPLPYYRPVFTVVLTIEYHLFGLWQQGWHLFSLLLHVACAIGVYLVLDLILKDRTVPALAALIFAVHPVHSESVCWISGLTDPLYGVTYLGSFYCYLRWKGESEESIRRRGSRGLLIASLFLFVVSAFSKETALSLVALVAGYELIFSSANLLSRMESSLKAAVPYAAAALIYLIPRYVVLGSSTFNNAQAVERPTSYTVLTLPFVLVSYLRHLIFPFRLSVTYATHFVTSASTKEFLIPAAICLSALTLLVVFRKEVSREVWLGLLLIAVPLVPVLRLGQVSLEEYLVFDHYLYLSVAGWALILIWLIRRLGAQVSGNSSLVAACSMLVILLYGGLAIYANTAWQSSYALWANAAKTHPQYWASHYNAGLALLDAKSFDRAVENLEEAARLKPDEAVVFDALGRSYAGMSMHQEAIVSFKHAIELDSNLFEAYNNLGEVYFNNREYDTALKCFAKALALKPSATASRYNLGLCYARLGRWEDSEKQLSAVAEVAPDDAEAGYELGLVYEKMGRLEQARNLLARSLRFSKSGELSDRISLALSRIGDAR